MPLLWWSVSSCSRTNPLWLRYLDFLSRLACCLFSRSHPDTVSAGRITCSLKHLSGQLSDRRNAPGCRRKYKHSEGAHSHTFTQGHQWGWPRFYEPSFIYKRDAWMLVPIQGPADEKVSRLVLSECKISIIATHASVVPLQTTQTMSLKPLTSPALPLSQ